MELVILVATLESLEKEDCKPLPVFRVWVDEEVLEFFAQKPIGWSFDDWIKEKLERKGINFPKDVVLLSEHPIWVLNRGFDVSLLPWVAL